MLRPALLFYCGQVRLVNWKYTKNYTICRLSRLDYWRLWWLRAARNRNSVAYSWRTYRLKSVN